jgi:hypothetical protein
VLLYKRKEGKKKETEKKQKKNVEKKNGVTECMIGKTNRTFAAFGKHT